MHLFSYVYSASYALWLRGNYQYLARLPLGIYSELVLFGPKADIGGYSCN